MKFDEGSEKMAHYARKKEIKDDLIIDIDVLIEKLIEWGNYTQNLSRVITCYELKSVIPECRKT